MANSREPNDNNNATSASSVETNEEFRQTNRKIVRDLLELHIRGIEDAINDVVKKVGEIQEKRDSMTENMPVSLAHLRELEGNAESERDWELEMYVKAMEETIPKLEDAAGWAYSDIDGLRRDFPRDLWDRVE